MNWEALDDPALVVPRVMDVRGTLIRLGFKPCSVRGSFFYRQFVPLLCAVPVPLVSRSISHVELLVLPESDDSTLRVYASYGYPERYRKKLKIIEGFKKLLSEVTHFSVHLQTDRTLRELEKSLFTLMESLTSKRVDTKFDRDSKDGIVKTILPEHEALVLAVQQTLCNRARAENENDWWITPAENERYYDPEPQQKIVFVNKHSRLPNFDRRRHLRGIVRRPV